MLYLLYMFYLFQPLEQFENKCLFFYRFFTSFQIEQEFRDNSHFFLDPSNKLLTELLPIYKNVVGYMSEFKFLSHEQIFIFDVFNDPALYDFLISRNVNYLTDFFEFYEYQSNNTKFLCQHIYTNTPIFECKSFVWAFSFTYADLSYLFIIIILLIITILMVNDSLYSNTYIYNCIISILNFIKNIVISQSGKNSEIFFPLFVSIFIFILFSNIIGLIPFCFCLTSQLIITFTLSFSIFIGMTIYGFIFNGKGFLSLFIPKNVPDILLPFLVIIEIISYISRTFSLAIRLFANMVAGHALLHILINSVTSNIKLITNIYVLPFVIIPVALLIAIILLELGIAFLQAYVFIVLFSIYLNDAFKGGH